MFCFFVFGVFVFFPPKRRRLFGPIRLADPPASKAAAVLHDVSQDDSQGHRVGDQLAEDLHPAPDVLDVLFLICLFFLLVFVLWFGGVKKKKLFFLFGGVKKKIFFFGFGGVKKKNLFIF